MIAQPRKFLSVLAISLMTVAAVVSLRGLPMLAKEGLAMLFYIGFSTIFFLLPASFVAAELGSAFSNSKGGVYTWVKAAFGARWGFLAIWLQWIQNVVWYPVTLAFAAGSIAYLLFEPALADAGWYNAFIIIAVYWLSTLLTLRGVHIQAKVTNWLLIRGTILPGAIIIGLGIAWIAGGNPVQLLTAKSSAAAGGFLPDFTSLSSLSFLAGILLLFAGVEVQAVHASEMKNPQSGFARAMFLALAIIIVLFTLGTLAVAVVVPASEISLAAGLMQAFQSLLKRFGLEALLPVMGLLTAMGAVGGVMAWIGGPSRGLLQTAQDGDLPPFFSRTNRHGIQRNILLIQGSIVTLLASLYLIMSNVSAAMYAISAMTISLYLVMYVLMYAAAIRLRYSRPDLERKYRVPGGLAGMWIIAGIGLLAVLFSLVLSFVPPNVLQMGGPATYVSMVATGLIVFIGIALLIFSRRKPNWVRPPSD
ncbi:MAG: amino acid permease [Chloroflexota bacterium]